jgi:transposase-like protein
MQSKPHYISLSTKSEELVNCSSQCTLNCNDNGTSCEGKYCCIHCHSYNFIKHGRTSSGSTRFRCRDCKKTWINNEEHYIKPDINEIAKKYLAGASLRDLVSIYKSSPLRLNQKLRAHLEKCVSWENYIDTHFNYISTKLTLLVGVNFSCVNDFATENNQMFVAMAIDAYSSLVIGYEINTYDEANVWNRLLKRMKKRNVICDNFMSNGSMHIVEGIERNYPQANHMSGIHKVIRENEIVSTLNTEEQKCKNKLINETINNFNKIDNTTLNQYLIQELKMDFKQCLNNNYCDYLKCLTSDCNKSTRKRLDNLVDEFKSRFEKFHSLKEEPAPIINAWIAHKMLEKDVNGFSKLELYSQKLLQANFSNFTENQPPSQLDLKGQNQLLAQFVCQVGAKITLIPNLNVRKLPLVAKLG